MTSSNNGYQGVANQEELMFNRPFCQSYVFAFLLTLLLQLAANPAIASTTDLEPVAPDLQPTPAPSCSVLELAPGAVLVEVAAVGETAFLSWEVRVWATNGLANALVIPSDPWGTRWWILVTTAGRYVVCASPSEGTQQAGDPEEEEPDPDPTG